MILDMYNCLKIPTFRFRKLLAALFVFAAICVSLPAANINWTGNAGDNDWNNAANWNPQSVPGEADTVIFNGAATIALTNDITVTNLHILSQTNIVTLDFSAAPNHSLTIKTRLRLGNGTNTPTGHLVLIDAEVKTKEFDTNDNGTNSLKLNNTKLTLTGNSATDRGKLLKNGTGTTTIDADAPATGEFIVTDTVDIPDNYNGTIFTGVTLFFGSRVTVSSPTTIWTGRTDSSWDDNANWLFGIPSDGSVVVIPNITPAPELSTASAELQSITVDTNATFTLSSGGSLSSAAIKNNGTITIKGGSISGTTSTSVPDFVNGTASSIIYDGVSAPVWDDSYNNLEIKSGSLTFSDDISVSGLLKISSDITNNATISASQDVTSTANISGSGTLLFTGNANQAFSSGGKSYSNIEENKNSGSLGISGNCSIDSFTLTKGSSTSFSGSPEITAWSDTTDAGALTFSAGAAFNSDTEIKTNGAVSLTGSFTTADLTITNGAVSLSGSFSSDSLTFTKAVNLAGDTSITSSSTTETVYFKNTITGASHSLTISTGATRFDGAVSGLSSLQTDAATINCSSIASNGLQSYNGEITLTKDTSLSADRIDFTDAISGSGYKLTVNTAALQSTAASGSKTISLSELLLDSDAEIKTQNATGINLDLTKISGTSAGKTLSLTGTGSILTFAGDTSFETNISTATGTTFTASNTLTFSADAAFADNTITATSGEIIFDAAKKSGSSATLSGNNSFNNLTFSGPVSLTGDNNINGSLQLTGTDPVSISGTNTINTFIAGTSTTGLGGKTISFTAGKKQTVTNTLSLYGSSTESKLTLSSTGEWEIKYEGSTTPGLKFISVKNSKNTSTNPLIAESSSDNGGNTKWLFPGQAYTWQGGKTGYLTDWDTAENWDPPSIPGNGAEITIPAGRTYYPVLSRNIDIDDTDSTTNYGNIINNGTLDLAGYNLKVYSITNNNLVRAKGLTGQKIEGTISNGTSTASTVEYYDAGNNNFFWDGNNNSADGKQYTNLIFNQAVNSSDAFVISRNLTIQNSLTLSGKVSVSGTTTISGGADKTVSLNNNTNTFTGNVIAGKSTNPSPFNAGDLTINAASQITLANNANAASIIINCPVRIRNVTTSGNQTYNSTVQTITAAAAINSSAGTITFGNTLTTGVETSITASAGQEILFNGNVTGSGKLITTGAASAVFTGGVSALAELETNAARINCSTLSTTGNQTYNGPVTVTAAGGSSAASTGGSINFKSTLDVDENLSLSASGTNGKIIFDAGSGVTGDSILTLSTGNAATNSISINGKLGLPADPSTSTPVNPLYSLVIGTAYSISFTNPVYLTSLTDTTGSGNISFQQGGSITSPLTLLTNGTVSISGTLNTASLSVKKTSLNGTVNTTGSQSYSGPVTLSGASSLISGAAGGTGIFLAQTLNGGQTLTIQADNSDVNFTGTIGNTAQPSIQIQKALNVNFSSEVKINSYTVTQAAKNNFAGAATIGNYSVTQSTENNFNGKATITSLTDNTNSGSFNFNAGGSITAAGGQLFKTNSKVTFGDDSSDSFIIGSEGAPKALTHQNGDTEIKGKLTAANIHLATSSITGTVTGAAITLGATSGGPMTITNSGLFTIEDENALNFTRSFTQNGAGNSVFTGSFTGSGTGPAGTAPTASFNKSLLLSGSSSSDFGNSSIANTINIAENLVVNKGAALSINAQTKVSKNIVLYNGDVTVNDDIFVAEDFIVLGSGYSTNDSSTGISNEYAYAAARPSLWSQPNYNLAQALPDGSAAPSLNSSLSASLTVLGGKTITLAPPAGITRGVNFYANGTSLSGTGSGQWTLKIPDLTTPANGFAEAYHSTITDCNVICNSGTAPHSGNGDLARLVSLECTDSGTNSNTNVDFDDFEITTACTVRDNAIYVEFNRPIRYHAAMINSLDFSGGTFTGFYSDPDCTNQITSDITAQHFYIKAPAKDASPLGAWNTDATGKSEGAADNKSSDRSGVHHSTMPYLDFPRALAASGKQFIITDIWGKRLNNYSQRVSLGSSAEPAYGSSSSSHEVTDKTGPVLWTVRTGQELHTAYDTAIGEASQHSYDSHNFLEFRYSEAVEFNSSSIPSSSENIQVTDSFGAISGSITSPASSLTFAGLAKITAPAGSSLQLYTGSKGSANKYMNALYRPDAYSIRLSIAGYTDGTASDYNGNTYKKWAGYIEKASQFTGAKASAVKASNNLVEDLAGNVQIEYAANKIEPEILSDSSGSHTAALLPDSPDLYSSWDLSEPVFTPLRFSRETSWGDQTMSEAIGNTNGSGSTLDRIDFHFFDNTPAYDNTDAAEWFTEIGWCKPGTEAAKSNLKDSAYTYCADNIGGARQFDASTSRRTSGGIRFSTKADISPAFMYSSNSNNSSPSTAFLNGIANVHTTVVSQLFTGSSTPMRPANDPDGLYLGLGLSDTNLSVETTFSFSYNENKGYLTDLAGNRLRSKTSKTIDRTPPSFDVIFSPVENKAIYIIFVKELVLDSAKIKFRDNSGSQIDIISLYPDFTKLLPKCFRIISIDAGGNAVENTELKIDTSIPAKIIKEYSNSSFTCIKLTTTKEIDIDALKELYVQLIMPQEYPTQTSDPLTNNINSRVTFIQDYLGNYMSMYSAHALSDFAINYVNPLYAYSSDMLDDEVSVMKDLYKEGSWAVHDWNANQQNYGTLPENHPVSIIADTKGNEKIRIYLSPSPDADSVSKQLNADFNTKYRIWLPALQNGIFRALSAKNNSNYVYADGSLVDSSSQNSIFNLSKETVSEWKSGKQISFMFGLMENSSNPLRIYNNPYYDVSTDKFNLSLSIPVPLYCIRMIDLSDLNTLDLWSFKLKGITSQRGGVTILNNVINADKGEKTVVKVDMPEDGRLNVIVMTLDGNIISYLNRGNVKAGEHYFTWDGKNKNGAAAARGMYFIRVTGSGIDETRKVMVVKD